MSLRTPVLPSAAGSGAHEKLTVSELCAELKVSRSTFYDWRQKGCGPRCIRLPNGDLRIRRRDLDEWLGAREIA
jgi:excisionase family DNA binding protein